MPQPRIIRIKRIYEPPQSADGFRVLVDRIWPRGISKQRAQLDLWAKELSPSTGLRKWFRHDPARFRDFSQKYRKELSDQEPALRQLLSHAGDAPIMLLYAARDTRNNHAVVLSQYLAEYNANNGR